MKRRILSALLCICILFPALPAAAAGKAGPVYADCPLSTGTDRALTGEEIYKLCSPAVFYIEVYDAEKNLIGTGSGFFISGDGRAVTNYHVIANASYATITMADGQTSYDVEGVYDYNVRQDIALLKIDGEGFPYLKPGASAGIAAGAKVYAIGCPLGLSNTISDGIVSNETRIINGTDYIQITAAISPGSSGGALLNDRGQVVGITAAVMEDGQNLNFAIPFRDAAALSAGTLKTLSQAHVKPESGGAALYPSSPSVTVRAGGTETVSLHGAFANASTVAYEIADREIALARWGARAAHDGSIPLAIMGLSPGETDIQLILYGYGDTVLAKTVIHVTVTK